MGRCDECRIGEGPNGVFDGLPWHLSLLWPADVHMLSDCHDYSAFIRVIQPLVISDVGTTKPFSGVRIGCPYRWRASAVAQPFGCAAVVAFDEIVRCVVHGFRLPQRLEQDGSNHV